MCIACDKCIISKHVSVNCYWQSLPEKVIKQEKKNEEYQEKAAKLFAQLSLDMREQVGRSDIVANCSFDSSSSKQWNALSGVMITDSRELQQYVLMK